MGSTDHVVKQDSSGTMRRHAWVSCDHCDRRFLKQERFVGRHNGRNYCSPECASAARRRRVDTNCALCGVGISKKRDRLQNKTGLVFCSRACKEKAQSLSVGMIKPPHYSSGIGSYRRAAKRHYGCLCERCGYGDCEGILEVHHIDGNRRHNALENLMVLCPNCHAMLTRGVCRLVDRKFVQMGR